MASIHLTQYLHSRAVCACAHARPPNLRSPSALSEYLFNAFGCFYDSFKTEDFPIGYKAQGEVLCIEGESCIALKSDFSNGPKLMDPYPVSATKNSDGAWGPIPSYTLNAFFFKATFKKPKTLIETDEQTLCYHQVASLPFTEKTAIKSPLCALCFVRLYPQPIEVGKPPPSAAPGFMTIMR